jgi:hypothetical protein
MDSSAAIESSEYQQPEPLMKSWLEQIRPNPVERSFIQDFKGSERFDRFKNIWDNASNRLSSFNLSSIKEAIPSPATLAFVSLMAGAVITREQIMNSAIVQSPPQPIEIQAPKIEQPKSNYLISSQLDKVIFANFTTEDIQTAKNAISQNIDKYKDETRVDNTMQWQSTVNQIVEDPRFKLNQEDKQYWKATLLQLVFVESEGNRVASSGIAFGLGQLKEDTAKEVADQYGVSYDLENGWENLFLTLGHQLNMAERYGKIMAPWIHHLGSGNADDALKTYFTSVLKMPVSEVETAFKDNRKVRQLIESNKVNPYTLLSEPAVTGKLKQIGADKDDTFQYYTRALIGGELMADQSWRMELKWKAPPKGR